MIVSGLSLAILISWQLPALKNRRFTKALPAPLLVVLLGVTLNRAFNALAPSMAISTEHLVSVPLSSSVGEFFGNFTRPDFSQISNPEVYVVGLTLAGYVLYTWSNPWFAPDAPAFRSLRSRSTAWIPRRAKSRRTPAPVKPPPMTSTSVSILMPSSPLLSPSRPRPRSFANRFLRANDLRHWRLAFSYRLTAVSSQAFPRHESRGGEGWAEG